MRLPVHLHAIAALLLVSQVLLMPAPPVATPATSDTWWNGTTCYEIFVRSFQDSDGDGIGDLQGVISRLDYLNDGQPGEGNDLGVGCIWLMPVFESASYHGYDVTDYEKIEADYGTNDDFRELMAAAHARDIHVILDFPINHTSSQHPWFKDATSSADSAYRDWYIFASTDPGYMGPWGQQVWHPAPGGGVYYGIFDAGMPDLDFRNPDVNAEIRRITEFWLTDMGVDGFRMDAIKHVIEDGQVQEGTPETIAWLREFSAFVRDVKPESYTVGEVMGAGTDGIQPYYPDTLDEYFQFELAQQTLNAARFGTGRQVMTYATGAQERLPDHRYATFLANHDQPRVATVLDGDVGRMSVGVMLLLSLPGTPFIYYGEEIGMPGDKPDPNIRTPMQWNGDAGGGFTTGTPYTAMQPGWETTNVASDGNGLLPVYRAWSQARETYPALRTGQLVELESGSPNVVAFMRVVDDEAVLVVINLAPREISDIIVAIPDGFGTCQQTIVGTSTPTSSVGRVDVGTMSPQSGFACELG